MRPDENKKESSDIISTTYTRLRRRDIKRMAKTNKGKYRAK